MISTIEISLIAVLAIINYQGVAAVTREREVGEIVPMRAEHSATQNDDVNRGAPNAIDLDFDTSSYTKQKDGSAWFKLTLDKVSCIKKVIRYRRDGLADLSWTCTQSADGRCKQCKAVSSNSCGMYTLSISTTEDAASSGASLPSNSDCKYGDTIELTTSSSTFILYELAVIAKEVVQCTLPAVSENSQYEVEGVAQGDGTNVAVGTSFTLVCDEGYTFKNSKTSVQTCTEDLATSDISNECTHGLADLSWTCTQSADGRCEQCDGSSSSCSMYTLSISTTEDAASSGASLPSNSDCKYGDTIELTTSSLTFILYELAVIAKEVVQCTLPAVSENSQYEVEGVAQGDGTNVAVGTSFTLVCDEGYTFKNSKTSVQTCTEDLATSDISNECTLVQCTLPAVSENSQYEVEGVAQGDGTNVAVGTSFTLVCDEGYTFKNSKTSVQTCTEDLATSDISNECTLVQCTLPAVSENSQYEVEGVAQGDGTNVAVGTSFTLVCDEGYTFKNSKTSVQTCTEDLATSDISNECTRQEEHEKYSAGTKAWSGHVFVVISTLLSFYIA